MAKPRASEVQATDVPSVKSLLSELTPVINWYKLGINLGLPKHDLSNIQQDYASQGNDQQKLEMLDLWLRRTPSATWGNVESALQQMGENTLAESICQKYNTEGGNIKVQGQYNFVACFTAYILC